MEGAVNVGVDVVLDFEDLDFPVLLGEREETGGIVGMGGSIGGGAMSRHLHRGHASVLSRT